MLALILETLGSTELLFILIIALMFFGPRKLPQISRSIGKSLAEFRKASEDFKRTWEREVALESAQSQETVDSPWLTAESTSIQEPLITPVPADQVIAHDSLNAEANATDSTYRSGFTVNASGEESLTKRDWL